VSSSDLSAEKRCPGCGCTLTLVDFAIDRSKASGRKSICLKCDRASSKAHYQANREEKLAKMEARRRAAGIKPRGLTGTRAYKPRRSEAD
jgi:hypothetical protein